MVVLASFEATACVLCYHYDKDVTTYKSFPTLLEPDFIVCRGVPFQ